MAWSVEFFPFFPVWVLVALGVAALAVLVLSALKNRRGLFLRVLFFACLFATLLNPSLKQEDRVPLSNIAVIAVDDSSSMKLAGRAERAREIEAELKGSLSKIPNLDVRVVHLKGAEQAGGEATNLFAALNEALADVPQARLAGICIITDGQIHDAPKDSTALGFDGPVHALIVGMPNEKDTRIDVVSAPRFGLVGTEQFAVIRAEWSGKDAPTHPATFEIRQANKPIQTVSVPYGEQLPVSISFEHEGPNLIELELKPEPGELTVINNRTVLQAQGVRENLHVLLVSGEPHAGERTWRNLLRSDGAVDLVHFTILRPPEKHDGIPIDQLSLIAFPTKELFADKLNQFDLIIFDRYQRRNVLPMVYLDNISRYVEHGGAVLVAAGADYASPTSLARTPLGAVLPARPTGRVLEQPFRPMVTAAGERHPVTENLPGGNLTPTEEPQWGHWFRVVDSLPDSGSVVMTGAEDKPLLILDHKGQGRVALLLSDHAWLWARGYEGGGPHVDLLRRLAHWLMKEPDLEEEALLASAKAQDITVERRTIKDKVGEAIVTTPSGRDFTITLEPRSPGHFFKTVPIDEPGLYRITMDGLTALIVAGEMNSPEFRKVIATDEPLQPLLEATGSGSFFLGGTAGAAKQNVPGVSLIRSGGRLFGASWLGLKARDAYEVKAVSYTPLIGGAAALVIGLGLLSAMWYREGR